MKTEHTPFPWRVEIVGGEVLIQSDGPGLCASINPPGSRPTAIDKENAAFIVRACNAHDDLVAALEETAERLASWMTSADENDVSNEDRACLKHARTVAAKAKGEA